MRGECTSKVDTAGGDHVRLIDLDLAVAVARDDASGGLDGRVGHKLGLVGGVEPFLGAAAAARDDGLERVDDVGGEDATTEALPVEARTEGDDGFPEEDVLGLGPKQADGFARVDGLIAAEVAFNDVAVRASAPE